MRNFWSACTVFCIFTNWILATGRIQTVCEAVLIVIQTVRTVLFIRYWTVESGEPWLTLANPLVTTIQYTTALICTPIWASIVDCWYCLSCYFIAKFSRKRFIAFTFSIDFESIEIASVWLALGTINSAKSLKEGLKYGPNIWLNNQSLIYYLENIDMIHWTDRYHSVNKQLDISTVHR